jgi:hypothetical protein
VELAAPKKLTKAKGAGGVPRASGVTMVARAFLIAAVAVTACACASPAPQRASLQSAVYMVGDNAPLVRASAGSDAMANEGQFPVIKRLYWFFAGR